MRTHTLDKYKKQSFFELKAFKSISLVVSLVALVFSAVFWEFNTGSDKGIAFNLCNPTWITLLLCSLPICIKSIGKLIKERKLVSEMLVTVVVLAFVVLEIIFLIKESDIKKEWHFLFYAGIVSWIITLGIYIRDYLLKNKLYRNINTGNKASIEILTEKLSNTVIPTAVMVGIGVLFLSRYLLIQQTGDESLLWVKAFFRAASVVIASVPASMAIIASSAICAYLKKMRSRGVVIKDGEAFEKLTNLDVLCFAMTGIITTAKMSVKGYYTDVDSNEFCGYVVALQEKVDHPISKALTEYFGKLAHNKYTFSCVEQTEGVGVKGLLKENEIIMAKWSYFNKFTVTGATHLKAQEWLKDGYIVLGVMLNGNVIGLVALADELIMNTEKAISDFKKAKITAMMLTGNNAHRATKMATLTGIEVYRSGLNATGKANIVKLLRKEGKKVAYLSDGVHDSEVFSQADIGILVKNKKSAIESDNENVQIMVNKFADLPDAVRQAQMRMTIIKRGLAVVVFINLCYATLACFGLINPIIAAILHTLTEVFVPFYAIAKSKDRPKKKQK